MLTFDISLLIDTYVVEDVAEIGQYESPFERIYLLPSFRVEAALDQDDAIIAFVCCVVLRHDFN